MIRDSLANGRIFLQVAKTKNIFFGEGETAAQASPPVTKAQTSISPTEIYNAMYVGIINFRLNKKCHSRQRHSSHRIYSLKSPHDVPSQILRNPTVYNGHIESGEEETLGQQKAHRKLVREKQQPRNPVQKSAMYTLRETFLRKIDRNSTPKVYSTATSKNRSTTPTQPPPPGWGAKFQT